METSDRSETDRPNENDVGNLLKSNIKKEFLDTMNQMINEFDLSFDYIGKDTLSKLREYMSKLRDNEDLFDAEMQKIINVVKPFEEQLFMLCTSGSKMKTSQLSFLENLSLFNDLLKFDEFKSENKNTKRELVKYINSFYMSACFLTLKFDQDVSTDELTLELSKFVDSIKTRNEANEKSKNTKDTKRKLPRQGGSSGGIDTSIFDTLFANPELLNMATDISKDMQRQNFNPMSLMSSLLSGKSNPQLNNLVNNITSKIEQKINTGEIDKYKLEEQAANIMSAVQSSDLSSQLPMLKTLLKNGQFHNHK